ncbi:uncharacterized protein LOC129059389 isoform X2 [Pongo abelii]|uniref:uncharacterized protein LOC129059389 isoform X2 n=1 Tax=Pongo abelii TaxID=9601 RepID=UPI0023E774C1|nr:uncharacterized protein LOC129059389 isoform X2 [Pongo abelii]
MRILKALPGRQLPRWNASLEQCMAGPHGGSTQWLNTGKEQALGVQTFETCIMRGKVQLFPPAYKLMEQPCLKISRWTSQRCQSVEILFLDLDRPYRSAQITGRRLWLTWYRRRQR